MHYLPRYNFLGAGLHSQVKQLPVLSNKECSLRFFMKTPSTTTSQSSFKTIGESMMVEESLPGWGSGVLNTADAAAFSKIYKETVPFALLIAHRYVPRDVAIDIVADVFLKLWRQQDKHFNNIAHVKGFLKTCIKNACHNYLDSQNRKSRREAAWLSINQETIIPTLSEEEIHESKMLRIYEEIEKLPPKCRRVFVLSYLRGMRNRDIADQLGIAEKTVRNQKVHALRMLRMALLSLFLYLHFSFLG